MNIPKDIQNLIENFKLFPGVGSKTAERYAFSILDMPIESCNNICENIINIKNNIITCPICGCLRETNKCMFCDDDMRDNKIVCVVENQKNVFTFEKTGVYKGKYHVLGGLISPISGINPGDLTIDKLINRVGKEGIKEIILALKPGIEGSTTSMYITKLFENKGVKITQVAQGIPIGADMEYLDAMTLEMALENRNQLS